MLLLGLLPVFYFGVTVPVTSSRLQYYESYMFEGYMTVCPECLVFWWFTVFLEGLSISVPLSVLVQCFSLPVPLFPLFNCPHSSCPPCTPCQQRRIKPATSTIHTTK